MTMVRSLSVCQTHLIVNMYTAMKIQLCVHENTILWANTGEKPIKKSKIFATRSYIGLLLQKAGRQAGAVKRDPLAKEPTAHPTVN